MTPTQRTLKHLRAAGYVAAVVERWNPHARVRQDLFGWLDIIAIRGRETLGVQCTSASNLAAREAKAKALPGYVLWLNAGHKAVFHGWRKPTKTRRRWALTERVYERD